MTLVHTRLFSAQQIRLKMLNLLCACFLLPQNSILQEYKTSMLWRAPMDLIFHTAATQSFSLNCVQQQIVHGNNCTFSGEKKNCTEMGYVPY